MSSPIDLDIEELLAAVLSRKPIYIVLLIDANEEIHWVSQALNIWQDLADHL